MTHVGEGKGVCHGGGLKVGEGVEAGGGGVGFVCGIVAGSAVAWLSVLEYGNMGLYV